MYGMWITRKADVSDLMETRIDRGKPSLKGTHFENRFDYFFFCERKRKEMLFTDKTNKQNIEKNDKVVNKYVLIHKFKKKLNFYIPFL